jgi:hypothetical protein
MMNAVFRQFGLAAAFLAVSLCPGVAQHNIGALRVGVVQNDTNNTSDSVFLEELVSVNDLHLRLGANRGDYNVQAGEDSIDDVENGVLISCVAENGRDNGELAYPGTNYCTSTIDYVRSGLEAGSYYISTFNTPAGAEFNMDVAAAFFPYTQWLGGLARNSGETNGGANDLFTGSAALKPGTHFIALGGGRFVLDLRSLGYNSTTSGVVLVCHGKNEANYALSFANPTNGTWSIFVKDNASNGGGCEQDPVAFVFVPRTNTMVVSGKFSGDGTPLIYNGSTPAFTVTNINAGTWRLAIPGQSPACGVLIVSAEGGQSQNQDNIVSYEPDGDGWIIQSRDVPGDPPALETPGGGSEAVASFVFVPRLESALVSPVTETRTGCAPRLSAEAGGGLHGNIRVDFYGRALAAPKNTNTDFTIVALPDTQYYSAVKNGGTSAMFQKQVDWIIAQRTNLNIVFVTHLGDITDHGGTNSEWLVATNALYRLENPATTGLAEGIPYGMGVGNHDQVPNGGGSDANTELFNRYFGPAHFSGKSYYGGHYGTNNNNSYQLFSAGGMDFISLHLEYDSSPGAGVMAWANSVLKAYPQRRAMVTSHYLLDTGSDAYYGAQGHHVYRTLRTNESLFLMLCGHVAGEGQRTDSFQGRDVRSFLTDYQTVKNGGNGWLRYYVFSPGNNLVRAVTYSPWLNQYDTGADSAFSWHYNMNAGETGEMGFTAISTNNSLSNGAAACSWTGLLNGRTYEWYAVAHDADGNTNRTRTWSFAVSNSAPRVTNQSLIVEGDSATLLVLAAGDPDGDALVFGTNTAPLHGLLSGADGSFGAFTYVPTRGYRGADRFTYFASDGQAKSGVATFNLTVSAPLDSNSNGLPDAWEAAYGVSDPGADSDGDGLNNLQEYLAGTNPTNAASRLVILSESRNPDGSITLRWPSVGGARYRVEFSDALEQGFTGVVRSLKEEMADGLVGAEGTNSFTDDFTQTGGKPVSGRRFYRVRVAE